MKSRAATQGVGCKNANKLWRYLSIYMFMCLFINPFAALFVYFIFEGKLN